MAEKITKNDNFSTDRGMPEFWSSAPVVQNKYRNETCDNINVKNGTFLRIIDTLRHKIDTIYQ